MSTYTQTQARPPPAALGRKNSFFGAIKNIVTAPLSWFGGSEEDFGDSDDRGKRRRLPIASEQIRDDEDSGSEQRTKRMRMGSPNRDKQPYLDPPRSAFRQHHKASDGTRIQNQRHVSPSSRKTLRVPTSTPRNRRTMSPYPSGSQLKAQPSVRTMSLDPPSGLGYSGSPARLQPAPTMLDLTEEKDAMSISREPSMSNLRMRTSVTPQPSGSDFGPVIPPRRERDQTEPPPLTALMSNPMFVKPPPGLQKSSTAEMARQATLGSLLDSQRQQTHSPARRGSVLFGTGSMTDISAPHLWPINPAEKALHELEVYKTPLLPSRLKGAPIPDTFIPKKNRPITLMHDRDRERKKGKGKNKMKDRDGVNGTKPYAGEGGMKKWLARRKWEEEAVRAHEDADRETEKERAMEEDESAEAEAQRVREQQKKAQVEEARRKMQMEVPAVPKAPAFEPKLSATREMSSLRVGRSRVRNHIERPSAKRTNRFSAAFEDDEDVMDDDRVALEEAAKKAPVFEIPPGFTFAKETPIPHDVTGAKEPPITKPVSALEPSTAPAPVVPTISFVPSTPQAPKSEARTEPAPITAALPTTASSIPNFFANTAAYTKPLAVTTHSGSFGAPPVLAPTSAPAQVSEALKVAEASASLFGTPVTVPQVSATPSAAPAASHTFGAAPASASTSIFGPSSTSTGTAFGAPAPKATPAAIEVTPVTSPVPSPAPPYASTPALSSSPFSFGAPPAPAEPAPANEAPKPAENEGSKPSSHFGAAPFSFGTLAVSAPAAEPSKPAFSFGEPASTPALTEPSKSAFSFGGPAPSTSPAPAPAPAVVIEVPKPFFGTQGTTTATGFPFNARPSTAPAEEKSTSVPTSFSFASASPAPAEKKSFTFGAPSPAPPTATATLFSFGHANAGSNAADTSKSFNFGQPAPAPVPARAATPPKADQEISMDESPSRDMNTNGKAPERPTLDFSSFTGASSTPAGSTLFAQSPATATGPGFGFGTASANPFAKPEDKDKPGMAFGSGFGQPSGGSSFGFGQSAPETTAPSSAAPFAFTQAASPSVAPTPGFGFGQTASNAFGQQQSTSSAPSSPSTFNRPATSFSFGTPASAQPAAPSFAFGGSQPASPATPAGGLPQPSGGAFAFGQSSGAAPAATPNSFAPAAASSGGGALFTIGAAPQPDGRQIKKLPRRGVGRR
ncbi:hypothetical protein DEU56DRAFT_752938 [Suillus clintonianus]|uniref:uncharacterized protein n=1 Tax=Suillus clintonianus TaxID=1904413 RepID=UPI001B875A50|nr:uncharacterized protein DEU56DRAFT_752938 [Suillus clintonianus]KAG2149306.1 hypothetical protein DEU56DRAFT_752938 [Suillus clintonianus]